MSYSPQSETILFDRITPDRDALKVIYAFPNTYTVGITSLGYQVVWANLATRHHVDVRRWFTDYHEPLPNGIDLIGFSFAWELDYGNLLAALTQFGLPRAAAARGDDHPLVFGGGPVLTANPEPYAAWFDVILLGDGEHLLGEFITACHRWRDLPRREKLYHLAQVQGVYVPSLYEITYAAPDGLITAIEPIAARGLPTPPPTIQKQTYQGNTLSVSTVVTPEAAWANIFMVEVVRSCPEMCRFCLASYLTLPFRTASLETGLMPAIAKGLAVTNRLGLLGASITQHPEFNTLLEYLDQPQFDQVRLSLASVRTNTLSVRLAEVLARHDSRSVTVAVESGSERLRQIINKKLHNDEIQQAAANAQSGGLSALKLYGMVGVPAENESDLEATVDMLHQLRKTAPKLRLTFGCSTFVPKAHTPWQWQGVDPTAEKKLAKLRKYLAQKGIDFRPESYKDSLLQALLSRGDRRLTKVLELAYSYSDTPVPSDGMYKRAFKELRGQLPPLSWYVHENWPLEMTLPWHHLRTAINPEILQKHQGMSLGATESKS
ncbi:MAG: radical SAM protein [Pseudanabaena sp. ELA607]